MTVALAVPRLHAVRTARLRREAVVCSILALLLVGAILASLVLGDFPVSLRDVWAVLTGTDDGGATFIVKTLRLPRALTGALVGAALGLSGGVFQSVTRNPLASPDVLGITAGASAAAVAMLLLFSDATAAVALAALVGALLTATVIQVLAWQRGVTPGRFVLVGIGLGAALLALTQFLLTRASIFEVQRALVWTTGSLSGRSWAHVRVLAIGMAVVLPVLFVVRRSIDALDLGDDTARALGINAERRRLGLLAIAVVLAGLATAAAGPVPFVAFVSAPLARRICRSPSSLLSGALVGALVLVLADLIGREAFGKVVLPVGVVTGLVGAPYLLWVLARSGRTAR